MQTKSYSVSSGNRIELWRGIPAEIEISGIENTSGDWLFLIDENWRDGSLLAGTVAASGEKLIVTLEEMNTVELSKAISSHDSLLCRATLTDKTSRVYIIPVTILNRAVDGVPTPVSKYYTKSQIDALIAGITAESIGAVSLDGLAIEELTSGVIPSPGKVYAFAPTEAAEMTFPEPVEGMTNAFRLRITMPTPAVAVTWPAGLVWRFAIPVLAAGTTTELGFAWTGENWEGWAIPDLSEYALLSGGNTFSGDQILGGGLNAAGKIMQGYGPGSTQWNDAPGTSVSLGSAYATGSYAVAAGKGSIARGEACMTVGVSCTVNVSGQGAVCVGNYCSTNRPYSFVAGNYCAAYDTAQLVTGQYNALDHGARVTGNGSANNARRNIEVLDWDGNLTIAGDLTFTPTGKAATTLTALIARIEALEQALN